MTDIDRKGFLALYGAARRSSLRGRVRSRWMSDEDLKGITEPTTRFRFVGTVSGGDEQHSFTTWRFTNMDGGEVGLNFVMSTSRLHSILQGGTAG